MILSYLKLALRIAFRSPWFALVNVVGLSVGIAVFLLLWEYTQSELHSDQFVKDYERIHRLANTVDFTYDGDRFVSELSVYDPYSTQELARQASQVESFTRILNQHAFSPAWITDHGNQLFFTVSGVRQEEHFVETRVSYADPNVFDFFGIPLQAGDAQRCLDMPDNIVLSASTARKYFKGADPINRIILLNDSIPLTVTGIFEDLPANTHLEFQIIISMLRLAPQLEAFKISSFGGPYSYLKLRPGAAVSSMDSILAIDGRKMSVAVSAVNGSKTTITPWLQPLSNIAFEQLWGDHFLPKSRDFLTILKAIAVIVLIVAWINYINLVLSRNAGRSKELATRKTIGARSSDFAAQFVTEALLTNVISLALAATVVQSLRQIAATYLGFDAAWLENLSWPDQGLLLSILMGGIVLTGLYPSYLVTRRSTDSLLKYSETSSRLSRVLIIAQYVCSIVLIIGSFAMNRQLAYVLSKDIGINRDEVIVLDLPIKRTPSFDIALDNFRHAIERLPFIAGYTVSNNVVGDLEENSVFIKHVGRDSGFVPDCNGGVDENYLPFYNVPMLAGRNFNGQSDTTAVLMSRQAAIRMGYTHPEDIVGTRLLVQRREFGTRFTEATVIGVFKDYKRMSFLTNQPGFRKTDDVGTLLMYHHMMVPAHYPRKVSIRIARGSVPTASAMEAVQKHYDQLFPGNAFNWYYLDQNISRYYKYESVARNQIAVFTAVVVGISCLGLLGMLMHQVAIRQKEIGIRKVLGARLHTIGTLLLSSSSRMFLVALLIGLPAAWYVTGRYLERYSVKVQLTWWHYLMPVMVFIATMLASVVVMVWRAGTTNPVDVLKHE